MAGGYSHLLVVMSPTAATKFGERWGPGGKIQQPTFPETLEMVRSRRETSLGRGRGEGYSIESREIEPRRQFFGKAFDLKLEALQ